MNALVVLLSVCGGLWLLLRVILPVAEALLFGVLDTWLTILNAGWKAFRPRHWWWLIRNPWVNAASRLFGMDAYTTEQTMGNWRHVPPFKLYRISKYNNRIIDAPRRIK